MHAFSRQEQDCVEAALHCHKTCLGMAMTHCLDEGGEHVAPQHFRLMIDCAAICATTADFIMHKSQFHRQLCALCADVCNACAQDCMELDGMEECVEACRRCSQACRDMA
jgi:hypothetical protein